MPGDKVFLDTNILVYAYDASAGEKHELAKGIVSDLSHGQVVEGVTIENPFAGKDTLGK